MKSKYFLQGETHFAASSAATLMLFVLASNSQAQTESLPNSVNLTVELQSAYNPGFKVCTPIVVNEPLRFSWARGLVQSDISASVSEPEGGVYPVKFALKEGMMDFARDVKIERTLELDKPFASITQKSGGFEISYKQTLLLSREACK